MRDKQAKYFLRVPDGHRRKMGFGERGRGGGRRCAGGGQGYKSETSEHARSEEESPGRQELVRKEVRGAK